MATPKAMKYFIQRRKDNNLCLLCGNPLDRKSDRKKKKNKKPKEE